MSYKREVCEVSLDGGIQDRLWSGVTQRRPVLVEKIHQLFADKPEKRRKLITQNYHNREFTLGFSQMSVLCLCLNACNFSIILYLNKAVFRPLSGKKLYVCVESSL